MLSRWQVLKTGPDAAAHPDDLTENWDTAAVLDIPAAVATIYPLTDTDDFDWWQRCRFAVDESVHIEFAGLTFPATVFLDGQQVAQTESMFMPATIECTRGEHELVIRFGSLNHWLKTRRPRGRWRSTLVGSPGLRWARTTLIGRAPVYGNIAAPVGIWRPISVIPSRIRTTATIRTDACTGAVTLTGTSAADSLQIVLLSPGGHVLVDATTTPNGGSFQFDTVIGDPELWWPNGYGAQPQYRASVRVDDAEIFGRTFGFRTVTVDDAANFRIRINGTPIFCRGATWSPPDPIRMHADDGEIHNQIAAFVSKGANMIRVIGGIAYEQREFWQACADAGLMVWQDAMLATFDPPAEQGELIARELSTVLDSVSGNPALVVVSGGSETLQQPEMLGLGAEESAMEVIDTLLPTIVAEHSDAHYVRASPAPPPGSADLAIRPDTGVAHWFGVGGYLRPIADVRSAGVKFAAECLAFANPPNPAFIERHFGSAAVAGHDPDWKAAMPRDRGSSWDFEDIRDFYAHAVFGEDLLAVRRTDPGRYLQLGRLAIAAAMHECFGYWRRLESGCGGALVLSGKDMQPGAGWGLLDYDGDAKPALTVLSRAWAPVAVVVSDDGLSGIRIDIHNDTPEARSGELTVIATNSTGTAVDTTRTITVPPASSISFHDAELSGCFRDLSYAFRFGPPTADAVQATVRFDDSSVVRDVWVVNPRGGQSVSLVEARLTKESDNRYRLELTAEVALRYVELHIPGWTPADNYFHLIARVPYAVALSQNSDQATPTGSLTSIDLLGALPIREDS